MSVVRHLLFFIAFFPVALSFLGYFHPVGDSIAVFRLPLALIFIIASFLAYGRRWLVICGMAFGVFAAGTTLSGKLPARQGGGADVLVYQKNLWFANSQIEELANDIRDRAPDVVTFQELSDRNNAILRLLADDYPSQVICPFTSWSGMAVLSRWPMVQEICSERRGFAAMEVDGPDGRYWIASIHLHWPYPHGQRAQALVIEDFLRDLSGPVILSGDFNMVPWGYDVKRLAQAAGVVRAGVQQPTLIIRNVPLPIDHIFAPGGGETERLPKLGSDHFGLLGRVFLESK